MNENGEYMSDYLDAIHDLFNNPDLRRKLLLLRWPLLLLFLILLLSMIKPEFFWVGLLVSVAGEAIQIWCFAALKKKKVLAAKGPYALVRNPMYIGRYFLILGGIMMTGNIWFIIVFSVTYYFYMVNRVKREEKILVEIFGDAYRNYCRQVHRFLPSCKNVDNHELFFFKWELFFKNNAHLNLLAMIICYLVVYYLLFHF